MGPPFPEAEERPCGTIMLVLQFAKRRGYPAETLTLRPAKCHCESATEKREIDIAYGENGLVDKIQRGFKSEKKKRVKK